MSSVLRDLRSKCTIFPLTNGHFKTIFWVQLYRLKSTLSWESWKVKVLSLLPVSPMNDHFKNIFQVKPVHFNTIFQVGLQWLKELCVLGDLNGNFNKIPSKILLPQRNLSWETWTAILRPSSETNSTGWKRSVLEDLNNDCAVSPHQYHNKWPLQNIFWSVTPPNTRGRFHFVRDF